MDQPTILFCPSSDLMVNAYILASIQAFVKARTVHTDLMILWEGGRRRLGFFCFFFFWLLLSLNCLNKLVNWWERDAVTTWAMGFMEHYPMVKAADILLAAPSAHSRIYLHVTSVPEPWPLISRTEKSHLSSWPFHPPFTETYSSF